MVDKKKLQNVPLQRIKPVDGMAVTAQIWEQAHEYHRQQRKSHDLLQHGTGIITGLEVIASDPPNSSVYILPGAAVDSNGDLIVLTEPVAYEFGTKQGQLYLMLSYAESRPEQNQDGGPLFVNAQFGVEVSDTRPKDPFIELARIKRVQGEKFMDAVSAEYPLANEIDMRYRKVIAGVDPAPLVSIAICPIGQTKQADASHGASRLAQTLRHAGRQVCVDVGVPIDEGLEMYTLIYLVAHETFKLSRKEMNSLYAAIQAGATVFMEGCRREQAAGASLIDGVFAEMISSFGIRMTELQAGSALFSEPNLFAVVPAGFETEDAPGFQVGDGLIVSANDFGCLWQGARRARPATREEIRTALEWGENLVQYALSRKKEISAR